MKRKSNLILFVCITFVIIMLSISTTLALVRDDETKIGNILKFEKVAIMADGKGSVLSVNIGNRSVGKTIEIIGESFGATPLCIKPAPENETKEMYIRFRVYFTFGDYDLDVDNETALNSFLGDDKFPMGFELYEGGADYEFKISNGWAYLIVKDSENLLKVVEAGDEAYTICNKYTMELNSLYETEIINVIETNNIEYLQMKVEAQAIQALGLANLTVEEGNEILSSGTETLEEKFGNATIVDYEAASENNKGFDFISGLPTIKKIYLEQWTWEEIKAASNIIEKALQNGQLEIKAITESGKTYDEIVATNSIFKVDNVTVKYATEGTYGQQDYKRIFTFTEKNVTNRIRLRDEKILKLTLNNQEVEIPMIVSNFLHDNKSDGRAGITFTSKTVIPNAKVQFGYLYVYDGGRGANRGYYQTCTMRTSYIQKTFLDAVKAGIGDNIIKTVSKAANYGVPSGSRDVFTYPTNYQFVNDNIWLLDIDELIRNGNDNGRKWYPIYVTNEDRQKVDITNGIQTNVNYATRRVATVSRVHSWGTGYAWAYYGLGNYMKSDGSGTVYLGSNNYTDKVNMAFGFCV